MEWLIGTALLAAGTGAGLWFLRRRKNTGVEPSPPNPDLSIEDQKDRFDESWRKMVAGGMDPKGAQAKSFIRHVQKTLGWGWTPPEE